MTVETCFSFCAMELSKEPEFLGGKPAYFAVEGEKFHKKCWCATYYHGVEVPPLVESVV